MLVAAGFAHVRHEVSTEDELDRLVAALYDVARPHDVRRQPRIAQVRGDRP